MSLPFPISAEVLERYRQLEFDPGAEPKCNILPLSAAYWPDEHPAGRPPHDSEVDSDSLRAVQSLLFARQAVWETGKVPVEQVALWDKAQRLIPNWPGFKRLTLSAEERAYADTCQNSGLEFLAAFAGASDEFDVQEDGAFSFTFDLERQTGGLPQNPPLRPSKRFSRVLSAGLAAIVAPLKRLLTFRG